MANQSLQQLISSAKYKHPEHTKQDCSNVKKYFPSLVARKERYTFENGVSRELICLNGTIPISFRDSSYNIPIGILISDNHPFEAPICYVRPTKDMVIKSSKHVDTSGRVYLPYLADWNKNTSDLLSVIQVMQFAFGQMCPVYKKTSNIQPSPATANQPNSMPQPTLPSQWNNAPQSPTYPTSMPQPGGGAPRLPFSSGGQNNYNNNSATISKEHIRASLLSAVEDKFKFRMRERIASMNAEIQVLKKTSSDLNRGTAQLDEMKVRMPQEVAQVTEAKEKLQELDKQLEAFIVQYDKEGEDINPDEVYGPTTAIHKQILDAFAEENAVVDAIYFTGEGLRKGVITLETFLRSVRDLSRRQFMLRALIRACRTQANLPN